jgi:hypothetical protein
MIDHIDWRRHIGEAVYYHCTTWNGIEPTVRRIDATLLSVQESVAQAVVQATNASFPNVVPLSNLHLTAACAERGGRP